MKNIKVETAITLVALIITIVVLLILATVSITAISKYNLIDNANLAVNQYSNKVKQEDEMLGSSNQLINEYMKDMGDTVAPLLNIDAYRNGEYNIRTYIYLSNVTENDYPITVEYYYRESNGIVEDYIYDGKYQLESGNTDHTVEWYGKLSSASSYDFKVKVIDKSGNSSEEFAHIDGYACFIAGTKVLTETGMKNIEDIKIGEKVYTINLDNNQKELKEVIDFYSGVSDEIFEITVNGEIIQATPRHQFYIIDKGWIRAYELEEGDMISSTGEKMKINKIEQKYYLEKVPVYNLTVEGNHNYLITEYELLVHNAASPASVE